MVGELTYRGRTYKTVRVEPVTGHTDRQVLDVALSTASESRSSLWGWTVTRIEGTAIAVATLHTD